MASPIPHNGALSRTGASGLPSQSSLSWGSCVNPHCPSVLPAPLAALAFVANHRACAEETPEHSQRHTHSEQEMEKRL